MDFVGIIAVDEAEGRSLGGASKLGANVNLQKMNKYNRLVSVLLYSTDIVAA